MIESPGPRCTSLQFSGRLSKALSRMASPLAAYARFALGVSDGSHIEWLCRHQACACGDSQAAKDLPGLFRVQIIDNGAILPAGTVLLCTRGGRFSLYPIVNGLIRESMHQVELEIEDEDFIHELGSNWESLHSLYEISADLRASRNIPEILGRILDRIIAVRPGLHGILWIVKEDRLIPAASQGAPDSSPRGIDAGILGRTAASRMPLVVNDRAHIRISPEIEPELLDAERIALTPIATRDHLVGVLEIWQQGAAWEIDAPTLRLFEALALQAAMVVESDRAHHISLAEERLRREFEIGGKIQETLLLGRPPTALPGVEIGVFTAPSHAIDGDFFDFLSCGRDCLDVFIGDVMGKGIPAALVGAAAKSDLLKAFGQLTAANLTRQLPAPEEIVTHVHQHLTSQLISLESFISLFYCRFDLQSLRMDFVDCGHPRAIHYRTGSERMEFVSGDNTPLGIMEGGRYTQDSVSFAPGDVFLFYSDGVTDAHDPEGRFFGEDRLLACFSAYATASPTELCSRIRESVAAFTGSQAVSDDLTCLAVRIGAPTTAAPSTRWAMECLSHLEFLPALRAWVRGVCSSAAGADARAADALELAVTEAASNIIRHAYEGEPGKRIIVEAQVFADRIAITLTHWGKRFRPPEEALQAPEATQGHGYGLYIISRMVDRVVYFDGAHGAEGVLLEKYLSRTTKGEKGMLATIEKRNAVTVVKLALDTLDASNEKRFKTEVVSRLEPGSKTILDLSGVDFVDSSGLGAILSCYRHLHAGGGDLKLCGLSEQVRALFELVRVHRIFDICITCDDALLSYSA